MSREKSFNSKLINEFDLDSSCLKLTSVQAQESGNFMLRFCSTDSERIHIKMEIRCDLTSSIKLRCIKSCQMPHFSLSHSHILFACQTLDMGMDFIGTNQMKIYWIFGCCLCTAHLSCFWCVLSCVKWCHFLSDTLDAPKEFHFAFEKGSQNEKNLSPDILS